MRYLCLIYLDEKQLAGMPQTDVDALNAKHLALNEELLKSGQFVEAEALSPGSSATCVRVRNGRAGVTDGPYAETKEMVAGFYLIEARDLNEAIQLASRIPPAAVGSIEVRPIRPIRETTRR